jgi:4-hydroxy-tetrahydrodipicolinate synthase
MTGKQKNSSGMADPGIYPMLYAFFDQRGRLRKDPFRVQVDASLSTHAAGVAILGLGTEVSKLTFEERQEVLEVVAKRIDGRKPLLVTIYGDTITEQIEFSKLAIQNGASALMLQPPSHKMDELTLIDFFSKIIEAVDCPIGVQIAPEFLGFGLSNKNLIQLANEHENFKIAKLECNAVNLASVASEIGDSVMIFNGRCGLELPDNLRAGASGLIPAIDTVDKTSEIFVEFNSGNEEWADELYAELLPVLCFVMQGIPHFLTYGKMLAAERLRIELGGSRETALAATEFGKACVRRFAKRLGPLN